MISRFRRSCERKTNRLRKFNYSCDGYYYVTICTKNKEEYFGEVVDGEMILNGYGEIADNFWRQISKHYKNVILDEYVIMPNHIHGIIIINNDNCGIVGNADLRSLHKTYSRTQMLLSKIIHGFKSSVTREINKTKKMFYWQKSFYDHIIRNEESLNIIRNYIRTNPSRWGLDDVID